MPDVDTGLITKLLSDVVAELVPLERQAEAAAVARAVELASVAAAQRQHTAGYVLGEEHAFHVFQFEVLKAIAELARTNAAAIAPHAEADNGELLEAMTADLLTTAPQTTH